MLLKNEYTYEPIKFNNINQGQKYYVGVDYVNSLILPKGSIICTLSGPKKYMIGNYFMNYEEVLKDELDSIALSQSVQVMPFYLRGVTPKPQYKTNARLYVLNEELRVASGIVSENPQFGKGEGLQFVIPNGKKLIDTANTDRQIHNPNHTIIPINLNTFQHDPRISDDVKEELKYIKETVKGNISIEDGSIILKNKEISKKMYKIVLKRTQIHETITKYNCLMKEYTDELQKNILDIVSLKQLKNNIKEVYIDLNQFKEEFDQICSELNQNPNLTQGFSKEHKEHLLKFNTCCPKINYQIMKYLEEKIVYLESGLSLSDKNELNIELNSTYVAELKYKENTSLENSINCIYKNCCAVDPYGMIRRQLVFAPGEMCKGQQQLKEILFCYLKVRDKLRNLTNIEVNTKVRDYCNKQIAELDKNISNYQKRIEDSISLIGKIENHEYDNKIQYLYDKYELLTVKERQDFENIIENKIMEKQIEKDNNKVLNKIKHKLNNNMNKTYVDMELQKVYDLNKFYKLNKEILEVEKQLKDIDDNKGKIENLDKELYYREEVMIKAKESFATLKKYKNIIHKYNNKMLFRKSYQKKHMNEKNYMIMQTNI